MKIQVLLLVSMFLSNVLIAQFDYDFSRLTGIYEGLINETATQTTSDAITLNAALASDYTLTFSINPKGSTPNRSSMKLSPIEVVEMENAMKYSFKILDASHGGQKLDFLLLAPDAPRQGVLIRIPVDNRNSVYFLMNREGGNPRY